MRNPMISDKPEYPPILEPGLHSVTVDDLEVLCVGSFPVSKTRQHIFTGLQSVIHELGKCRLQCDMWVDGSFLTAKIDPEDVDFVLCVPHEVYDGGSAEQRGVVDWVQGNLKDSLFCDSYVFFTYPEAHPLYWQGHYMEAYWTKQFGFARSNHFKGIAVIKVVQVI